MYVCVTFRKKSTFCLLRYREIRNISIPILCKKISNNCLWKVDFFYLKLSHSEKKKFPFFSPNNTNIIVFPSFRGANLNGLSYWHNLPQIIWQFIHTCHFGKHTLCNINLCTWCLAPQKMHGFTHWQLINMHTIYLQHFAFLMCISQ